MEPTAATAAATMLPAAPAEQTPILDPDATASRTLQRRGLFRYFDGVRDRFGDVLEIQFRLQIACPGSNIDRLDVLLDAITAPDDAADRVVEHHDEHPAEAEPPLSSLAAMVELAPLVAAGFDLPAFDDSTGVGLSIQERVGLLTDYFAAMAADPERADEATDEGEEALVAAPVEPPSDPASAT